MTVETTLDIDLNNDAGYYDISIDDDGDISTEDSFWTNILMTLFCDKRALPSEMPDASRRRGWIGNESTPDFEVGSKAWLYYQERLRRTIIQQLSSQLQVDFNWFVDEDLLKKVKTQVVFSATEVGVNIIFQRPQSETETRYYKLWDRTN